MSDLDLDALEATARAAIINDDPEDWPLAQAVGWDDDEANDLVSALTPGTVLALIADSRHLREAEAVIERSTHFLTPYARAGWAAEVHNILATYKPTNQEENKT